ncbi:MAG: threonylcarbamoyl-AMP synthase, partial [Actinobacteria bacterium]|nr:threonylcarbamoyl-AMP synthase [Actinomycetota bacterium]
KGRPPGHPVIVHVASSSALQSVTVEVSPAARALADSLWPGPLTLVLRRRPGAVVDEVTGGGDTVGIRVPDHPVARALLDAAGVGVAAPSANRFGRVSPTTAADVSADLGDDVDLVLDGGPCRVGVESTIVDCTVDPPRILRHGGVAADRIASVVGALGADSVSGRVAAPGTL